MSSMDVVSSAAFNTLLNEQTKSTDLIALLRNELDAAHILANMNNPRNFYLRDLEQDPTKIQEFHETLESFKSYVKVHRFEGVNPSFIPRTEDIQDQLWIHWTESRTYGNEFYAIVRFKNGLQGFFNLYMDNMPQFSQGYWTIRPTQRDIILNLSHDEQAMQTDKVQERSC